VFALLVERDREARRDGVAEAAPEAKREAA
jgi:hypothetical protein